MRLYFDGIEYNIITPEGILDIEIIPSNPITNNQKLLSSDNYILKDIDSVYLTALEYIQLLSSDDSILTDIENKYLTIKKG